MTIPVMMAYAGGLSGTGAGPRESVYPDWARNQVFLIRSGTDTVNDGIDQFTGYPTGTNTLSKSLSALGITGVSETGGRAAITPAGYIVSGLDASNSTKLLEFYAPTLALASTFGAASSSTSPSVFNRILTPGSICPLRWGNTEYIVSCASGGPNRGEVTVLTIPGLALTNLGNCDEPASVCGPGTVGTSSGTAFVLGYATSLPATSAIGVYVVSAPSVARTKIGTITPAAIDATWTHYSSLTAPVVDQTDGNLIFQVSTADAVTNQNYLVKLNKATAALIWKIAVNAADTYGNPNFSRHTIQNGRFYYMGTSNTLYHVNTVAGTATTETVGNLTLTGAQVSEDISDSIVLNCSWAEVSTHPTYIGDYMGTGGNHSLTDQFARYFPAGPTSIPNPPPIAPQFGVVSNVCAWTFVQDGHTFYVIDIGTQGTFAFDTVTSQWSQFQTAGGNWAMTNGVMWGQRVVAGDPASTDVWELDPGATMDSGNQFLISHVSTGGISTRARTYISCDAVRVSASFGELDDGGSVSFNLRFSDDQEQTWSPYFTVTLTEGAFDTEVAWRSLGSFNAPGRIFELSDSGGLIRIDGCDAFLNGFDNDQQDQEQPVGAPQR